MAISKNLSLSRPLDLPKPAPTAKPAAPKPAQTQGGIAGQAEAPHKPATKPQGQLSRPSVDSFNPNTKPKPDDRPIVGINPNAPNGGVIIPGGGWANPQRTEKPDDRPIVGINPNAPNGGVIIPGGGWANQGLGKPEVTGPAIGGRNRDVVPNNGAYDLGAAFDRAFDQGVILDATTGGAELRPGGGWGDLVEANKDSIPPGWANNE